MNGWNVTSQCHKLTVQLLAHAICNFDLGHFISFILIRVYICLIVHAWDFCCVGQGALLLKETFIIISSVPYLQFKRWRLRISKTVVFRPTWKSTLCYITKYKPWQPLFLSPLRNVGCKRLALTLPSCKLSLFSVFYVCRCTAVQTTSKEIISLLWCVNSIMGKKVSTLDPFLRNLVDAGTL